MKRIEFYLWCLLILLSGAAAMIFASNFLFKPMIWSLLLMTALSIGLIYRINRLK